MKIFFRYLFLRVLQPFFICLAACAVIWIMVDLYGNMDDFLEHKVKLSLIFYFYSLQVPMMLVQVLPATILFSTLFTLFALNRRSELVALQAGGMAPLLIFSPFLLFGVICVLVLAYDMSGPAAVAEVTRERVLKQVKGQTATRESFTNLPYVDTANRRVWYFQDLDGARGHVRGIQILQCDGEFHDMEMYLANEAQWTGEFWRLSSGVTKIIFGVNNYQTQKNYQELDLPDVTTPPKQLSLIVSQPNQLTLSQLSQYIATSGQPEQTLVKFRTEWWYRVFFPLTLIILMIYALLQGARIDRRGNVGLAVGTAIIVLMLFYAFSSVFLAAGNNNRLPPFIAAGMPQLIFGSIGLYLLAIENGWWWQLLEYWKRWQARHLADGEE